MVLFLTRLLKAPVRLVVAAALIGTGLFSVRTEPARGDDKQIVLTGWVDCGRRSEAHCPISDTLTLWTDDFGLRQKMTIDVEWISAQLPSLDQDDFVCVEVTKIDGAFQATALVTCKDEPAPKRRSEKNQVPTATPTRTPVPQQQQKVVINIQTLAPQAGGPLVAAVPEQWSTDGGRFGAFVVQGTLEGGIITFEVTLSQPINEQVKVDYHTEDIDATGTAACNSVDDYISQVGTLTFAPNQTSRQIPVQTCPDENFEEDDETMKVVLTNPSSNAVIGTGSAIGTIIDNTFQCLCAIWPESDAPPAETR